MVLTVKLVTIKKIHKTHILNLHIFGTSKLTFPKKSVVLSCFLKGHMTYIKEISNVEINKFYSCSFMLEK